MRAALVIIVLALAGCGTVPGRYAEGAACTTALFLGPAIGFPIAMACGLHEVHKEIAAEEADTDPPKAAPKDTPRKKKHKVKPAPPVVEEEPDEEEPEYDNGNSEFEDEMGGVRV